VAFEVVVSVFVFLDGSLLVSAVSGATISQCCSIVRNSVMQYDPALPVYLTGHPLPGTGSQSL